MATSPIPTWAREQSPHHRGPTGAGVLFLALVVIMVVLALQAMAATDSGERSQGSLCDQHRGQPAWEAVCEDARGR